MNDTIVAIATPMGEGGISVIRLSGDGALSIALKIFKNREVQYPITLEPQRAYFGKLINPFSEQLLDEVVLTYFRGPQSYTREDVIEISAHGGIYVSTRILQLILDQGARLAEPGEFTRRAFLNGRIDLSQAEAVADLIGAASERALQSALGQLQGRLSQELNGFYDQLIAVLAQLETAIDFPEEGLEFELQEKLQEQVSEVAEKLKQLADTYRQGKIYREGARVALAGKPNVGKSSLLNALLQEDRAIVTPHPGTTRDLLEECIRVRDVHIVIVDSAGLRPDPEPIEKEGIARARAALKQADLTLIIFDGSRPFDLADQNLIDEAREKSCIAVINKNDLPKRIDETQLPESEVFHVSAINGAGIDILLDAIYSKVTDLTPEAVIITRERHRDLLLQAGEALNKTLQSFEKNLSEEFIAADIQYALDHLGRILGKIFEDDLIDQIFREFCIGK